MKKNKIVLQLAMAVLPLMLLTMGCAKFLDRKPLTATLDDLKQGTLEAQSFGLYNTLTSYAGFSTLPWLDFHSIRDDDAQKGSSTTDGKEINTEFETFQYSKDDWAPNTYWNDRYYMINLANKELYYADSLKVSDPASLRNIGEARFFRAYCYFDLVRTYGDVPLINFYYTNAADGIKAKSPVAAIYAQIDEDLNLAAQYLPLNWSVGGTNIYPGRLTRGAANTLWAQTHLFRGDWAQVVSLCNQVIQSQQYSLTTNFPDIWKDGLNGAGKNGPESIFEEQSYVGPNNTPNKGTQWGTSQNVRQGGASNAWNLGWGWNTPTQKLVSAWDSTDPRKSQTILYSGQYDGGPAAGGYGATLPAYSPGTGLDQPYWNKKVYSDPAMRQFTGQIFGSGGADWINHRILRYADVILMLAEASNELGDGATAATNLELIRNRASGNLGPTRTIVKPIPFVDQDQMRAAIKNERRFEFAMEGYRFFDLVRWGDAVKELGSLGYTNRCRYYPIPQQAINLSGGILVQNPEW
ncbi:RagB/SusD family nutrient uptake outer membrane protein [Ferruginibacter paludis]|uniref:RagB/SusD family nutrient uptake outer membrane protein n=1 Tax=Ferruginibacter paludis TaxID=1310417 RepID=UPI0025B3B18F|nr:RagB/SusD family nutrient uptake outer membrane protein [Ferruginibacter paludis]MDN3657725.1 RagB/SusD family nutrient uptake outer membrane protein [Ferruginibacter paludis]